MNTHEVKAIEKNFLAYKSGAKLSSIRKNDRDYKVGDKFVIKEYDNGYTGEELTRYISHIDNFEQKDNYVVLSLFKRNVSELGNDIIHLGDDLYLDGILNHGHPRSYHYMQLFRTKCNRHFIGNCRGDEWRYKCSHTGEMKPLPEDMEVDGWVTLK